MAVPCADAPAGEACAGVLIGWLAKDTRCCCFHCLTACLILPSPNPHSTNPRLHAHHTTTDPPSHLRPAPAVASQTPHLPNRPPPHVAGGGGAPLGRRGRAVHAEPALRDAARGAGPGVGLQLRGCPGGVQRGRRGAGAAAGGEDGGRWRAGGGVAVRACSTVRCGRSICFGAAMLCLLLLCDLMRV